MPTFYHPDLLDHGLDRIRAQKQAGNDVEIHLVSNYTAGDSYATVNGNSLGGVDLATGDLTLDDQGTNGREVNIAAKSVAAATGSSTTHHSGTATAGASTTLTETGAGHTVDEHIGRVVVITGGTGSGQKRRITDNDATVLTVESAWTTNPSTDSTYEIRDDLHIAVLDKTDSKVLAVVEETSEQVITSGNPIDIPAIALQKNQPTSS